MLFRSVWREASRPLSSVTSFLTDSTSADDLSEAEDDAYMEGVLHSDGILPPCASAIIESVIKAKPASCKGRYLKSATISSTMGPGVQLDAMALTKQWS